MPIFFPLQLLSFSQMLSHIAHFLRLSFWLNFSVLSSCCFSCCVVVYCCSIQIPPQTCNAIEATVHYHSDSDTVTSYRTELSLADSNRCNRSSSSYTCEVQLGDAQCWKAYDVSVTYNNSVRGESPYSSSRQIPEISECK